MRVVLTIAGSDSSAGAGLQADLKTLAALGVYGVCAVTAVTAQSTAGIVDVLPLPADLVSSQIEAVAGDVQVDAVKTGMLATAAIVEAAAAAVAELDLPRLVVDPVMVASSGRVLLDEDGLRVLKSELLPKAMVVTPNIAEAVSLSGLHIASLPDARDAARKIRDLGPTAVIITGGHRSGRDVVDVLFDGRNFTESSTARVEGRPTHGTGCAFSAALAAYLATGLELADAAARAQVYVAGAIRHGLPIGSGRTPLDHFWNGRR